jgi:predicted alpha/beta-fold hydrolase
VQTSFPEEALVLGGCSLGGNFSLRIAAVAGEAALRIERVVAVCPVLDPAQTMQALDLGLWAYRYYFIRRWRRSLQRKKAVFPSLYDFSNLERFQTLREMTDYFVTNYTEFPDLQAYLRGYALTGDRLAGLEVPSTMLLAEDDPVIPIRGLDEISAPNLLNVHISRFGGHCGFINGPGLSSFLDDYFVEVFGQNASDFTRDNRSQVA